MKATRAHDSFPSFLSLFFRVYFLFFSSFVYTYSNLETHFGFASIPLDESRLDQRLDVAVNRYVEIGEGCVGGSKEKEKGEGNGGGGGQQYEESVIRRGARG